MTTWAALVALLVPYAVLVRRYAFVCDDAFITWRYSRNWALGHGPRYNLGAELPVEGYSDFLWMALGALVHALHLDPIRAVPAVSIACGIVLLGLVFRTLRVHVRASLPVAWVTCLGLAIVPPFAVWSTSGLETMAQALLMFATWLLLGVEDDDVVAPIGAAATGLLLTLVRTEGVAWLLVIVAIAGAQRLRDGRAIVRPLLTALVPALLGFGAYFAWRYGYYHSLFANTAYAKVHLSLDSLGRGVSYVALALANLLTPALIVLALPLSLRHERPSIGAGAGVLAIGVAAYAVAVSGDYMAWFRILVPGLPFLAVCFGSAATVLESRARWGLAVPALALVVAVVGFLPTRDLMIVPRSTRVALDIREKLESFRNENDQWAAMVHHVRDWKEKGEALASYTRPGDTLVAAAIGSVGYYSDLFVYDRNGLVTREVAMAPWDGALRSPGHDKTVGVEFFLDKEPTILDAKLISGGRLRTELRQALREMDAEKFEDHYFPDIVKLPPRRRMSRALVLLRRAATPEEAAEGWEAYRSFEVAER